MKSINAIVVTLFLATPSVAQQLTMDSIFGDRTEERPQAIAWAPGGTQLGYLWSDNDGQAFWVLDAETGASRPVLHLSDLESQIAGFSIDSYHWLPQSDALLIESSGDLFICQLEGGELSRLTETEAEEADPKVSPSGDRVAFVRGQDLFAINLTSGDETRLTFGGEAGVQLNGLTDWIYWEELWGRDSTGFWWSPQGDYIAYYQFDESPVREYALVDFQPQYPEVEWQKYPKAGEDNPRVRVGVLDVSSGETVWMSTGDQAEWYLPRVDWLPSGDLAIQRLNRDQNRLDLLRCEAGSGECSTWLSESRPTWVDVSDDYHFLADGTAIWPSERSGWNQIYLVDANGDVLHQISSTSGSVTSLIGLDENGDVLYQAYDGPPLGALSRQVYRSKVDGTDRQRLSPQSGWNSALLAPGGRFRLQTSSSAAASPTRTVRSTAGSAIAQLPYEPLELDLTAVPQREFFTIRDDRGRDLPASIIRPASFDPSRSYPVIMYHYGGPESQVIRDAWSSGSRELWTRMMAQRGFVMFSVDNPGSNFFGQQGADALHRRFGEVNLAAQRAAVEYLGTKDWVDASRIGLWGWSGGGSNTLYSVLKSPGTWRAAVSGAPVTDWRLYDTIWTERYLDHPDDNPDGYRDSSAVTWADQLSDALLLVHGTADDNVHPQNSLVMTRAFVEAGVPFDQAIYPRQKHGFRDKASRHFYEKMTVFFERELAESQPDIEAQQRPKG